MESTLEQLEFRANAAAQSHMGQVAWPTILLGCVFVFAYFAVLWLAATGFLSPVLAFISIAVLVYASYTVVHEAVHGSINGKNRSLTWLNNLMGYMCAQLFGVAFTVHRKEHLAHHRHTNQPGKDPDLSLVSGGLASLLKGIVIALPVQFRYYLKYHWRSASKRERLTLVVEYALMITWRMGFFVLAGWQTALLLLVGATLLGFLILLISFAWIVHRSFDVTGRYKDTSTIIFVEPFDTIVTWLWLYQNYHSIHHLFPRVPFYRYRKLFAEIEDAMKANGAPITYVGRRSSEPELPSIAPEPRTALSL